MVKVAHEYFNAGNICGFFLFSLSFHEGIKSVY